MIVVSSFFGRLAAASGMAVPLTVRVGDELLTREVDSVQFRKEAIGGVRSISFKLARPLSDLTTAPAYTRVYVYDGRSAATIAEGRISDAGRSAGSDGQSWDVVAFGPLQHASDKTFPYVVVDQGLGGWQRASGSTKNATTGTDDRNDDTPSLMVTAAEGKSVSTSWRGHFIYLGLSAAGMKIGRFRAMFDCGVADGDYQVQILTRAGGGADTSEDSQNSTTSSTSIGAGLDAANVIAVGQDRPSLRVARINTSTTGAESHWFEFWDVYVRAMLLSATGANVTTGYTVDYALAHQVVNDLLGRVLDQFDGATAVVDTGGVYQIDQFAYPDGVTAEQVLTDLMLLEPAYRWTTGPNTTDDGYSFKWEPWPTTVRYEATLDDGGDFPVSAQELFTSVTVRWTNPKGKVQTTTRTAACPILDAAGVTRTAELDLGDEIGSATAAARAGDGFLADHNIPRNAGTLSISRPIRDLISGRMVDPFEIEPGELIRVRGVESYPDALNASSNDGLTVFRIWAMTYTSDSNTAQLELDTDARTTTNALAKLAKRRPRKR